MPNMNEAVLVLSFGGPERSQDVLPFLHTVLRGKNVPEQRILEVAEHYYHFGGRSPINDQNRELIAALTADLREHGLALPVYWGNRNWHPFLADTLRRMREDGVERAMVFVTSAFSSYSGCRQYLEDLDRARAEAGASALRLEKLPVFCNRPGFIESVAARVTDAFAQLPPERRDAAGLLFTAHSIPLFMAHTSPYVAQLREACRQVAASVGHPQWELVYQSRSGPPSQPWLEPDIADALRQFRDERGQGSDVVVSPIGFISDHMEVVYDLDTEVSALAAELGLNLLRAATPGVHPRFISMIRELIVERISGASPYLACAPDCCPPPRRDKGPAPPP
jgi:ferrochelatase